MIQLAHHNPLPLSYLNVPLCVVLAQSVAEARSPVEERRIRRLEGRGYESYLVPPGRSPLRNVAVPSGSSPTRKPSTLRSTAKSKAAAQPPSDDVEIR